MKRIPILICIDIEPEERRIDPQLRAGWTGFERSYEFFTHLRPRLSSATGSPVHFSWFLRMDPQIACTYGSPEWVVTRYPQLFENLAAAGDEFGLHVHPWRWDEKSKDWIADFEDQEWIEHCITSSFDAFHRSLNRPCQSFRFGDHWMNNVTLDLLERLGVRFDLTLEPGQRGPTLLPDESFRGFFSDYSRIPRLPYYPDKADFTKPSQRRSRELCIIPTSAGDASWIPTELGSLEGYLTLNLGFHWSVCSSIMDTLLAVFGEPYVVLVARTNVASDPNLRVSLKQNVDYLLSQPLLKTFSFETPAEAMQRLTPDSNFCGLRTPKKVTNAT